MYFICESQYLFTTLFSSFVESRVKRYEISEWNSESFYVARLQKHVILVQTLNTYWLMRFDVFWWLVGLVRSWRLDNNNNNNNVCVCFNMRIQHFVFEIDFAASAQCILYQNRKWTYLPEYQMHAIIICETITIQVCIPRHRYDDDTIMITLER